MGLFRNVEIDVARPEYNKAARNSPIPKPHLHEVEAYLGPLPTQDYSNVPPDLALKTLYLLQVDIGIDIYNGDTLTRIVLLSDGVTPYPTDVAPAGRAGASNVGWIVRLAQDAGPGPLAQRNCTVERVMVGGFPR